MDQTDSLLSPVLNASVLPAGPRSVELRQGRRRNRLDTVEVPSLGVREDVLVVEALVADERLALRPAQVVESKLTRLLKDSSLPVSHLQMRGLLRMR
jgi:hypothetical protein